MARKIFIGELNATTNEETLRNAFAPFGTIVNISIDTDGGHVEYRSADSGATAITRMNGTKLDGVTISVSAESTPIT